MRRTKVIFYWLLIVLVFVWENALTNPYHTTRILNVLVTLLCQCWFICVAIETPHDMLKQHEIKIIIFNHNTCITVTRTHSSVHLVRVYSHMHKDELVSGKDYACLTMRAPFTIVIPLNTIFVSLVHFFCRPPLIFLRWKLMSTLSRTGCQTYLLEYN